MKDLELSRKQLTDVMRASEALMEKARAAHALIRKIVREKME